MTENFKSKGIETSFKFELSEFEVLGFYCNCFSITTQVIIRAATFSG